MIKKIANKKKGLIDLFSTSKIDISNSNNTKKLIKTNKNARSK